jgi:hypothetical protein
MQPYTSRPMRRKSAIGLPIVGLPLFDWRNPFLVELVYCPLPVPRAADVLARRFQLPLSLARLVAEHAGFAMESFHE